MYVHHWGSFGVLSFFLFNKFHLSVLLSCSVFKWYVYMCAYTQTHYNTRETRCLVPHLLLTRNGLC